MKVFDDEDDCYFPSFYNIYINTSKTLSEMFGSDKEPELFHEYLHFYQDIATTFGLQNSSHVLNKIKDMYHYVKKIASERNETIKLPLTGFDKESTDINLSLFKLYLQYTKKEVISTTELLESPVKKEELIKTSDGQEYPVPVWEITTTDFDKYNFGAHAIMEGICHNLQKEIYGIIEPYIQAPYNLSKMIWDYMLPDQKNNLKAFIDLSEVSLMHLMSGSVFVETLIKVQNSEIRIDENFYQTICALWKTETPKEMDIYENFDNAYTTLLDDIKGTLTSPLYNWFIQWLKQELKIGYELRFSKRPVFSSLLFLKNLNKEERTKWLSKQFNDNGYPPVRNSDGHIFCHQMNDIMGYLSILGSIVMSSTYDCLVKQEFEGCTLKENCIAVNEQSPNIKLPVDDNCTLQPWCKKESDVMCPFAGVWNTWGLTTLNFSRE